MNGRSSLVILFNRKTM